MKLFGRLMRRERKKEQPKHEKAGTQESSSDNSHSGARRRDKWIVRHRLRNGRLKHLCTLQNKPTEKDLAPYGPGEYSIQKVAGGSFSKSEKITIEGAPREPPSRPSPALDQGSGQSDRPPITDYRRPPQAPKKLPSPSTTPSIDLRRGKSVSDAIKRPKPQMKSDRPLSSTDRSRLSTDDGRKQDIESIVKRISELLDQATKNASAAKAKSKSAMATKREAETRESARSSTGRLQLDSQPEGKTVDAHSVRPSEDVRLKDESKLPSQAPTANSKSVPEPTEKKKYISCTKCNDPICAEDELSLFKYGGKRCEFCSKEYCDECYEGHLCSSSEVCSYCGNRFSKDLGVMAQLCQKIFCSQRCLNMCFEKNQEKDECWDCCDREEDTEEEAEGGPEENAEDTEQSDRDEDDEWDLRCKACGNSIKHDDRNAYVCLDCKDEDTFCYEGCFNRYHWWKKLNHKGMTFGEYDDSEEERRRKSKVRVVSSKRGKVRVIKS